MSASVVLLLFVATLFVPRSARAEAFIVPWVGGNAGEPTGASLVDLGASIGATTAGVVDVDVDLGYSPDYFGSGFKGYVLTTMGDVALGIPFGRREAPSFRPYFTGGLGLIRSHVESVPLGYRVDRTDLGVSFGGGLTVYAADHVGVRADLRRVRGFDAGGIRYWRTSIGVVIR